MREAVLLKPVEEGLWGGGQVGLLHHYHTLKVLVDTAGFDVGANGYVGIVTGARVGVDAMESAVEEIVETLVDGVCLAEDNSMTFSG